MSRRHITTIDPVDLHNLIADDFDKAYARSSRFKERLRRVDEWIRRLSNSEELAVDAGCGSGVFTEILIRHNRRVQAFDPSPAMLALCQRRIAETHPDRCTTRIGHLDKEFTRPIRSAGLVVCSSVIEYIPNVDDAIATLAAMLRPGGHLILTAPNGQSLYRSIEKLAFRATGRPRYFSCVRHVLHPKQLTHIASGHQLQHLASDTFSPAPLIGRAARSLGLRRLADTMVLQIYRLEPGRCD